MDFGEAKELDEVRVRCIKKQLRLKVMASETEVMGTLSDRHGAHHFGHGEGAEIANEYESSRPDNAQPGQHTFVYETRQDSGHEGNHEGKNPIRQET